jgi:hypothetical protein
MKTYLPLFTGFYNTIWEMDDSYLIDEMGVDTVDIDYKKYQEDVSKELCRVLPDHCDLIDSILFESLVSPQFYNFVNDSINCEISLSLSSREGLDDYLSENADAFAQYLKVRYTSRDGFSSSYSNNPKDWSDWAEDEHKLGAVLDFWFMHEDVDEYDVYQDVVENLNETDYIK